MHKIEVRIANNGVVVERFENHVSQELWVYSGSPVTSSAALCVQGMLDELGLPNGLEDNHNLHVTAQEKAVEFLKKAKS